VDVRENAFTLEPGTRSAQFFFEIMSLQERSGKTAEYSVDGLVENWTPVPSNLAKFDLSTTFSRVNTRLNCRLLNASGEVESAVSMPWTVEAFFWQRTWFRALVLVLFLLLVGGSLALYQDRKLRATRVKLLETERELYPPKQERWRRKPSKKAMN
jgi:hypothetical protein